ncbi:hypothetical protein REPUB_Repub11eG0058100 [Reevesia pubescens]
MAVKFTSLSALCLLVLFASNANAQSSNGVYEALLSAWKDACALASASKIVIPNGAYLLSQVTFEGPCQALVGLQVEGTLKAPADPGTFNDEPSWVTFQNINQFTLSGFGTFDGQGGKSAWGQNDCKVNDKCNKLPINIRFNFITNGMVRDITSLDSKKFHINLLGCKNLTFANVTINAPEESPNTDGIHIGRSSGINITDSKISTDDDCISLGDGSQQINISRVTFGPGHGISIGSLGKFEKEEPVVGVVVVNCTLTNTMNGVRVKTWPASFEGIASDIYRIKISNVSFKNIRGTSATQLAVNLACSSGIPFEKVVIGDIDLSYIGTEGPAISQCSNAKPTISGQQNPTACGVI